MAKALTFKLKETEFQLEPIKPKINDLDENEFNLACLLANQTGRDSYATCPRCDAYALGIELERGFPLLTRLSRTLAIFGMGYASLTRDNKETA